MLDNERLVLYNLAANAMKRNSRETALLESRRMLKAGSAVTESHR